MLVQASQSHVHSFPDLLLNDYFHLTQFDLIFSDYERLSDITLPNQFIKYYTKCNLVDTALAAVPLLSLSKRTRSKHCFKVLMSNSECQHSVFRTLCLIFSILRFST